MCFGSDAGDPESWFWSPRGKYQQKSFKKLHKYLAQTLPLIPLNPRVNSDDIILDILWFHVRSPVMSVVRFRFLIAIYRPSNI